MIEFTNIVTQSQKTTLSPLFEKALKYFPDLEDRKILISTTKKFTGILSGNTGLCSPMDSRKSFTSYPKSFKITLLFNENFTPSMFLIGHELMHIQMRKEGLRGEELCDVRTVCLNKIFLDSYPTYLIYTSHKSIIENWENYALHGQYLCKLALARSILNNDEIGWSWLLTQFGKLNRNDFSTFMSHCAL